MKVPRAAFIFSEEIEKYRYPAESPFKTERAGRTKSILSSMGCYTGDRRSEVSPVAATGEELLLFHSQEYIDALKRVSNGEIGSQDLFLGLGSDDCPIFPDLYNYSALAAGGTIRGASLILNNEADIVFNPNGGFHHALRDRAGGFCYINDVALAGIVLSKAGKKVLCLDFDAHHGNGTQTAFYTSDRVFTLSFHESGETLYPWGGSETETGEGAGRGYNLNMPFPAETDDDIYFRAFENLVVPLLGAYNPDVIMVITGMDILSVDPLTHLKMTNNVIADILQRITRFEKPVLALGAGGYSPEDTARGWALCWTTLCGIPVEDDANIGLGGVFMGSTEWNAGLRDRHFYLLGENKNRIAAIVEKKIEFLRKAIFPVHGIG